MQDLASALFNVSSTSTSCDRDEASELSTLVTVAVFSFFMLVAGCVSMLFYCWDRWYSHAASSYFVQVDRDQSGNVDSEELYTGLLQLYAAVPVKVYPPKRRTVNKIVKYLEETGLIIRSGSLNVEEFSLVMATLSAQCLGRIVITVIYYMACPIAAGLLWTVVVEDYLDGGREQVALDLRAGVPHIVRCGGSIINALNLGPPLLTMLLMLPLQQVVRAVETGLKHLLLMLRRVLEGVRSVSQRQCAVDAQALGHAAALHRRKSQIRSSITQRMREEPLLSSRRGEDGQGEDEDEDEEAVQAAAIASRISSRIGQTSGRGVD